MPGAERDEASRYSHARPGLSLSLFFSLLSSLFTPSCNRLDKGATPLRPREKVDKEGRSNTPNRRLSIRSPKDGACANLGILRGLIKPVGEGARGSHGVAGDGLLVVVPDEDGLMYL